ncbi:DNA polymerase/3'-5' exonuclease PolX [Savagea sp. SN6]|uniref:DNA-directed DNA polymerase n=1 Tax=Savagea serpentis TaxID=2785297 RepID=A0A8J7GCJ9_9BACL|nr:DNA polymerase/3'-5' exonuclease PolX [Savagea serpentis]MBF4501645.1 DNA polymerase/3'-5' exonuclease PolX [Savagea serpentis]
MDKKTIIRTLEQIALHMELLGENPFKISAFRKAANTLELDGRSLAEMDDIYELKGIGKSTGTVIQDLIEKGESETLKELERKVPRSMLDMLKIPGLGGKRIAKIREALGIESIEALYEAAKANEISQLPGFGKKTEQNFIEAIEQLNERSDKHPLWLVEKMVKEVEKALNQIEQVKKYEATGSYRRREEESSDLDFIVVTDEPDSVTKQLKELLPIDSIIGSGESKFSFTARFDEYVDVDIRFVTATQFATAIHHFTGSKDHNVKMRQRAKERGEKISEYGVTLKDGTMQTFDTEEQFFNHFDLPFIPPNLRQNGTELEKLDEMERMVKLEHMNSDLHMHTTWSDGAFSIGEMREALKAKGYTHAVITDHSQYLKVANGLTPERLFEQQKEIAASNIDDFLLLSGTEMDILPDGSLDFDDEVLANLDFVIASIHSSFNQKEEEIMHRLHEAMKNPHVDMIAHPTGRVIGKRDGYAINIPQFLQWAKQYHKIVEVNASPYRLDLSVEHLKLAKELGVWIAINTDAHAIDQLDYMELGVLHTQKAYIEREQIVNTWTKEQFLERIVHK